MAHDVASAGPPLSTADGTPFSGIAEALHQDLLRGRPRTVRRVVALVMLAGLFLVTAGTGSLPWWSALGGILVAVWVLGAFESYDLDERGLTRTLALGFVPVWRHRVACSWIDNVSVSYDATAAAVDQGLRPSTYWESPPPGVFTRRYGHPAFLKVALLGVQLLVRFAVLVIVPWKAPPFVILGRLHDGSEETLWQGWRESHLAHNVSRIRLAVRLANRTGDDVRTGLLGPRNDAT